MTAEAPRPLRADARRNRESVLEAARVAFAAEGLAVPLDEIARRAGVGAGTVYRHFPTKEALFEAIVVDNLHAQAEQARSLLDDPEPAAALAGFFRQMVERGAGNRAFADALTRAGVDLSATGASRAGEDFLDALGALLARAQRAGVVRAELTAKHVKAMLIGVLNASEWLGGDAASRELLASVVCDGLRAVV